MGDVVAATATACGVTPLGAALLAGRVDVDLDQEPLGTGADGKPVFLRDIWPSPAEIDAVRAAAEDAAAFRENYYAGDLGDARWNALPAPKGTMILIGLLG